MVNGADRLAALFTDRTRISVLVDKGSSTTLNVLLAPVTRRVK